MMISEFNQCSETEARSLLIDCCHSVVWAERVSDARPFASLGELHEAAESCWAKMAEADILEAFSAHPKIGDLGALRDKYSTASAEQGQVTQADESVLQDLMEMNRDYEQNNGFIFIVCATGKSAAEMRDILAARMNTSRLEELAAGASEQAKITKLRLDKLFHNETD